jgi:hypothetical protein
MKMVSPHVIIILMSYFLAFSVMPQDYGFIGKAVTVIEKMSGAEDPGINSADDQQEESEEEESTPPTLVEEEDIFLNEHLNDLYFLSEVYLPYYISNEDCSGIIPSIPIPPPDCAVA